MERNQDPTEVTVDRPDGGLSDLPRFGRVAGVLFVLGALASLPSSLLLSPAPASRLVALTALALGTGLVVLALPWHRLGPGWLHAVGVVATLEVSLAVALTDRAYIFFYVFIAVFAAYTVPRRQDLVVQLGLIGAALLAPLAYEPEQQRATVMMALLAAPALAISAGSVFYLRRQLEADRRAYRAFAEETLALASRIRRRPTPAPPAKPGPGTGAPSRGARVALAAGGALAVIAATPVCLAAAGVDLPAGLESSYEELGVELEGQGDAGTRPEASGAIGSAADRPEDQRAQTAGPQPSPERSGSTEPARRAERPRAKEPPVPAPAGDGEALVPPEAAEPERLPPSPTPGAPAEPDAPRTDPLGSVLDELERLLPLKSP